MDTTLLTPVPGTPGPITEADLHAFADGQLEPARRAAVEDFLSAHPAERERLSDWQAQNLALRRLLDPVVNEPVPLRLHRATARRSSPWLSLAAGIAIAVVSASSAWWLRGLSDTHGAQRLASAPPVLQQGQALQGFAHRAAIAHVVYSPDQRRPVEVSADQEQALVTWLTRRIGTAVRPPDLRPLGYHLIGGRLLPGEKGPVAQFMFGDDAGQRLTLYVTREDAGRETAFRFGQDGQVNVFYWVDKDFGYAISASANPDEVARVARAVYDQLAAR